MVSVKNPVKSFRADSHATSCDSLTRAQYYDRKSHTRHLDGESRLLFAVLEDAIRCVLLCRRAAAGTQKRRELAETIVWVNIRGDHGLFSFDSICAVFEIDSETLRRKLNSLNSESDNRPPRESDRVSTTSKAAVQFVQRTHLDLGSGHRRKWHSRQYAEAIPLEFEPNRVGCRIRSARWSAISGRFHR